MNQEYLALSSEVREIESILADIPLNDAIERMSFEARLRTVKARLVQLPEQSALVSKAYLTFRGKPVVGSHGIGADFGSKAASLFADAFAVVAAGFQNGLRDTGPIPDKSKHQLLITGTAVGSFGFEFEVPVNAVQALFADADDPDDALEKIQHLLQVSSSDNDDAIAELVEAIHPRGVKKVREFMDYLVQQQAWCGLKYQDRVVRYDSWQQLQTASERLREENIVETTQTYRGQLRGTLPDERRFEFQPVGQQDILKGKVDPLFGDMVVLNREWLLRPVEIRLHAIRVGKGKPRLTLRELTEIRLLDEHLPETNGVNGQ